MSSDTLETHIPREDHVGRDDEHQPSPVNEEVANQKPVTLVPLKTVLELRAEDAVTDVYITAVPVKSANSVISYVLSPPLASLHDLTLKQCIAPLLE